MTVFAITRLIALAELRMQYHTASWTPPERVEGGFPFTVIGVDCHVRSMS
jgi:hypothetical protein